MRQRHLIEKANHILKDRFKKSIFFLKKKRKQKSARPLSLNQKEKEAFIENVNDILK